MTVIWSTPSNGSSDRPRRERPNKVYNPRHSMLKMLKPYGNHRGCTSVGRVRIVHGSKFIDIGGRQGAAVSAIDDGAVDRRAAPLGEAIMKISRVGIAGPYNP